MASENAEAQAQTLRLTFVKGTDVGRKRGHNEDYVDAFRPSDPEKRQDKGELFIVADGMGGHQAGEVASEKAVQSVSHEYYASEAGDPAAALVSAIEKANTLIHRLAQESTSRAGMGTTTVAAVVRGDELYIANVGDSRAYLQRNGKLAQVTRDHSFVQDQIEAGILSPEEARTHPQRNVVTRALGSKPQVKVDTFAGKLQPGDTLLLCTDGLSEHVPEEDMASILSQYPPKEAVPRLIALANRRGGSDNITALVLQVASDAVGAAVAGAPPPDEPAATQATSPAGGGGLSLPLVVGLGTAGLLIVAAAVVGLFIGPRFLWGDAEQTPAAPAGSALPTATVLASSSSIPPATATLKAPSPSPTATGTPEEAALGATSTPRIGVSLLEPKDGSIVRPGAEVAFRWQVGGDPSEPVTYLLRTNRSGYEDLYEGSETSYRASLPAGEYQWWVDLRYGDTVTLGTERRTLFVVLPPTATRTPSPAPTLAPPTTAPVSGGTEGGGGTGDPGDGQSEPTQEPADDIDMPTIEPPTMEPTKEKPLPPPPGG